MKAEEVPVGVHKAPFKALSLWGLGGDNQHLGFLVCFIHITVLVFMVWSCAAVEAPPVAPQLGKTHMTSMKNTFLGLIPDSQIIDPLPRHKAPLMFALTCRNLDVRRDVIMVRTRYRK